MWPQARLPPHPAMAEETRQSKLAAAKRKLKEYWQRNSPGVPAGAKRNRKTNGSIHETATSGGCHSPGDSATGIHGESPTSSATLKDLESPCQELAVVPDSRSVKVSQLKNTIKSLVRVHWGPLIPRCQSWALVSPWGPEERGRRPLVPRANRELGRPGLTWRDPGACSMALFLLPCLLTLPSPDAPARVLATHALGLLPLGEVLA
uniref:Isoform 4 of Golgin subfamily A member 8G n=1 Tax=Homo sapiens TaxID=9606 RepID=P0DX53-4